MSGRSPEGWWARPPSRRLFPFHLVSDSVPRSPRFWCVQGTWHSVLRWRRKLPGQTTAQCGQKRRGPLQGRLRARSLLPLSRTNLRGFHATASACRVQCHLAACRARHLESGWAFACHQRRLFPFGTCMSTVLLGTPLVRTKWMGPGCSRETDGTRQGEH